MLLFGHLLHFGSKLRNTILNERRKVELLLTEGKKADATVALREAEAEIMRGVSKGVIHKNTASRKVSRLSKRVKELAAA